MTFNIETERLLLREMRDEDLDGLFTLDSNPNVHKYLGNRPIKTKAEAQTVIDSVKQQYKQRGIGRFTVIEKATGNFVGWSGLRLNTEYNMNGFTTYYDIGYRLIEDYWGKGYATESGKAAAKYAFEVLNLKRLYATTHIDNHASHNALLKIGLHYLNDFYFPPEKMTLRWYKINNPKL